MCWYKPNYRLMAENWDDYITHFDCGYDRAKEHLRGWVVHSTQIGLFLFSFLNDFLGFVFYLVLPESYIWLSAGGLFIYYYRLIVNVICYILQGESYIRLFFETISIWGF